MVRQRHSTKPSSFAKPASPHPQTPKANISNHIDADLLHDDQSSTNAVGSVRPAGKDAQTMMTNVNANDEGDDGGSDHSDADVPVDADVSEHGRETMSIYAGRNHHRPASTHTTAAYIFHSTCRGPYSDRAASTRSLWARELDYRDIGGRRYCKEYYMPNDDVEQLRLTIQHQVLMHAFDGELTVAPLSNPTNVLDVGTGTGEWAIRFAELFPDCEVVGTDISAIQETQGVPMNVFYEIEDAEEWDRPSDYYDLIHLRCMEGAFRDWRSIYEDAFDALKPGGWIQVADYDGKEGCVQFFSNFSDDSPVFEMLPDLFAGAEKSGRKRGMFHLEPQYFYEAGFVDVQVSEQVLKMDIKDDPMGKLWLMCWLDGMEAYYLRTLMEQMGWDPEVVKNGCRETAREIARRAQDSDSSQNMVLKMRTVVARKPSGEDSPVARDSSNASTVQGGSSAPSTDLDDI